MILESIRAFKKEFNYLKDGDIFIFPYSTTYGSVYMKLNFCNYKRLIDGTVLEWNQVGIQDVIHLTTQAETTDLI